MLIKDTFSLLIVTLICLQAWSQCPVNVQIQEGSNIEMCENNPTTISGTSGFNAYGWSGPETVTGQTITPSFSGTYTLYAVDGDGCLSSASIEVLIHPTPADAIQSSEGNPFCSGTETTLSLTDAYVAYDWGNGNTESTLQISEARTYTVDVVDNNGCVTQFSIIMEMEAALFDLNVTDNGICNGGSTTLVASGGSTYQWSTGETTSTIVVDPDAPTVYTVAIDFGGCSTTLSHTIDPSGIEAEDYLPDTIFIRPGERPYVIGPSGFDSYSWYPAESVSHPTGQGFYFYGDSTQLVTMTAVNEDGCIWMENVLFIVINLNIPNGFSPNHDGYNDQFVIPGLGEYPLAFTAWNRWGDVVFESSNYQNDWDGTCRGPLCLGNGQLPEGTYFYKAVAGEIILTGYITLKR